MGKTSAAVKNRYNAKVYDRVQLVIPKGRKADLDAYAKSRNQSINGLLNSMIREILEMTEEEWKKNEGNNE